MKKALIFAITISLLALCVLGLSACGNGECRHKLVHNDEVKATVTQDGVIEYWKCKKCEKCFSDFEGKNEVSDLTVPKQAAMKEIVDEAIKNAAPVSSTVTNSTVTELGTLNGSFTITYQDGVIKTVDYSYEQLNKIGEGEEVVYTATGTISRQEDGSYTDGGEFTANATEFNPGFSLNLNEVLSTVEINEECDTVTATVSASKSLATLGIEFDTEAKLEVKIDSNGSIKTITATTDTNTVKQEFTY